MHVVEGTAAEFRCERVAFRAREASDPSWQGREVDGPHFQNTIRVWLRCGDRIGTQTQTYLSRLATTAPSPHA